MKFTANRLIKSQQEREKAKEQERISDFIVEYEALCKKHGMQLYIPPVQLSVRIFGEGLPEMPEVNIEGQKAP